MVEKRKIVKLLLVQRVPIPWYSSFAGRWYLLLKNVLNNDFKLCFAAHTRLLHAQRKETGQKV